MQFKTGGSEPLETIETVRKHNADWSLRRGIYHSPIRRTSLNVLQ